WLRVSYAKYFRASFVSLSFDCPTAFSFGSVQAEAGNPRNPTVVLFLKIPRVLCSHPLTGGPGFYFVSSSLKVQCSRSEISLCKWKICAVWEDVHHQAVGHNPPAQRWRQVGGFS